MTGWLGGGAGSKSVPSTPLRPTHQNIFNSVRTNCAFSMFEWKKMGQLHINADVWLISILSFMY